MALCQEATLNAVNLFTQLGFVVYPTKLVFQPTLTDHSCMCASHVNPQYHYGFGRIIIKFHLTGKARLIFNFIASWINITQASYTF